VSDIHTLLSYLPQTKAETVADMVGTVAIVSPWWLPYLKTASEEASFLLPIGGLILIAVNVVARILITRKALRK
jgi:hypothetical protein